LCVPTVAHAATLGENGVVLQELTIVPPRMSRQREVALQQTRRAHRVARYEAVIARHRYGRE
jgi:hypothetical protein